MANLRANKITSTEVFETTGSVQFDGNGDYLSLADSNDWNYSTGDFTIEFWYYFNSLPDSDGQFFYSQRVDGANYNFIFATNTKWEFDSYESSSQGPKLTFTTTHNLSTWNHLAVTRSGNTFRLFVNGVESATQTNSDNLPDLSAALEIGRWTGGPSRYVNGHISNFRIIKGQALYTKNFTPPTRELTVIPNTVLLACQSTTNAAREATGKTITVNGNAVANELTPGLLTDRVRSGGTSAITGSVEFDGNDYLLESTGADGFNGGLGDWTVEAWMYCTDASQSDVLINGLTSSTDRFYINFIGQTLYVGDFSINNIAIGGVKQINSWFHIAVTKSGSTYRAFINGVLIGSSTESLLNSTLTSLQIGYRGSQNYYTKGFISNLRIIKGTAVYTSNFIPPTRELKKIPNTVLLCCKNSSDPTAEETGKTITVNGNATPRNFSPQVGFDGYVEFLGPTKISTENYFYLPTGNTEDRGRGRGLFGGGYVTPNSNIIDFIQIQTQGIAQDFGDLTYIARGIGGCSSSTRGIFAGGAGGTPTGSTLQNIINFVTIASTGNAQDFGDLTSSDGRRNPAGASNNTRGLFAGGIVVGTPTNVDSNIIDYITIASIGNAIDFGDLTSSRFTTAGCSNATRGVFGGGDAPTKSNVIDYITLSSTGNAITFGNLSQNISLAAAAASNTRGIFAGGYVGPTPNDSRNVIEYVTISSTGNAQDFGDLVKASRSFSGTSNNTRGVFGGGYRPSGIDNALDFIIIATTGNAQDFGDLSVGRSQLAGCSDSHGGLG